MRIILCVLTAFLPCITSLYMYMPKSTTRCLSQELDNEDVATISFGREHSDVSSGSVVVSVSFNVVY